MARMIRSSLALASKHHAAERECAEHARLSADTYARSRRSKRRLPAFLSSNRFWIAVAAFDIVVPLSVILWFA